MAATTVVHFRQGNFDVYIGRPRGNVKFHYGNPFTYRAGTKASVVLPSGADCIQAFRDWLAGDAHQDVEPERRQWILEHLHELRGKRLACWCAPSPCHGDVLAEFADAIAGKRSLTKD